MTIGEATFVVVDVETTGLRRDSHRVIEIAAVRFSGGFISDTFHSLVDPECGVPSRITRLTGLSAAHLYGAPTASEVLPEFTEFLGSDIFVAHNVRFDFGFINAELERAGMATLTNPILCTVRLARRLLQGLPSKGLDSLIAFYGLEVDARHRAEGDAVATAKILARLLDRIHNQFEEVRTVPELLAFQRKPYKNDAAGSKNLRHIRAEVLPELPDAPGVYFMRGRDESLLYVGKARHLGRRVRSYFAGVEGHAGHVRELVRRVWTVTWETTATELQALLLESRYIKEFQPRYNRASRRYRNHPFLRLGLIQGTPWLTVINHIRQDGAAYYGPLGSRQEAESATEALVRLYGKSPSEFKELERVGGAGLTAARIGGRLTKSGAVKVASFLRGDGQLVLKELESRMWTASEALKYEWASRYRNWIELLEHLLERPQFAGRSLFERHGVALLRRDDRGELHFFACGRPVDCLVWPQPASVLTESVHGLEQAASALPERLSVQQVDEVRLFLHWMHEMREHLRVFPWRRDTRAASFAGQLHEHLA